MKRGEIRALLITVGIILVITGTSLAATTTKEEPKSIFEEIPNEEVHTYIKETEQGEDIPVNAELQGIQAGELYKEPAQAAGKVIELTYEEAQLLLKMAQAEAGNQGTDGMWMVMSVVINRVKSSDFPDTITDVIYQDHQFSSVSDGRIDQVEISADAHKALARIEQGDVTPEIIGFEITTSEVLDQYFVRAFEYKDHRFYTAK